MRLFTTEAVSKYHPDKYADQISDAILTECLKQDKGCMPPKGGNCRFTPTGNAVREF